MSNNNNPSEYSLSRTDEPKDKRGTPACDLRIDPSAAPNLSPDMRDILREKLRRAEEEHKINHKRRKRMMFWRVFRVIFLIITIFVFLFCVGTLTFNTAVDYLLLAVDCAISGAVLALILSAVIMPVWFNAYNACFADEYEELRHIESIKYCISNQKGQA